jgi:hypothetical protein
VARALITQEPFTNRAPIDVPLPSASITSPTPTTFADVPPHKLGRLQKVTTALESCPDHRFCSTRILNSERKDFAATTLAIRELESTANDSRRSSRALPFGLLSTPSCPHPSPHQFQPPAPVLLAPAKQTGWKWLCSSPKSRGLPSTLMPLWNGPTNAIASETKTLRSTTITSKL